MGMIFVETMQEFDTRHSQPDQLPVPDNNCLLFFDGAVRDASGRQFDPPTEPGALLRAKRKYVAVKLRQEEEAWNNFKNDCQERLGHKTRYANPLPGPRFDAVEQLERGAERIQKLREELAALDREIAQLPREVNQRALAEEQRQRQQAAREQLSEIASMTI